MANKLKQYLKTASALLLLAALPAITVANAAPLAEPTNTKIRCGYLPYEPYLRKDPNTGNLSGLLVDYINQSAQTGGVQVEWTSEIPIDQIVIALNTKKIDVMCLPLSPDSNWRKNMDFSGVFGGIPYDIYVAKGSSWTERTIPSARFVVVDGMAQANLTMEMFPQATRTSLGQLSSPAEMYDQIKYKKADAIIGDVVSATGYQRNNKDVIERLNDKHAAVPKMFWGTKKGDTRTNKLVSTLFSTDKAENAARMRTLMNHHGLTSDELVLGTECKQSRLDAQGVTYCMN